MTTEVSPIVTGQQPATRSSSSLRRIRVLHVVPSLYGGGMERLMLEVIRASTPVGGAAEGCRITHGVCILRAADDRLWSQCKSMATTWVLGRRKTRDWTCWKRLRQVIRDFDPEVVEALSTGAWVDAARAIRGRRQTRLALTFHGQVDTASPGRLRRWLNRWAARKAAAIISVSKEAAERMARDWGIPASKLVALPNGVDVNRFRPAGDSDERGRIRQELGMPPAAKVAVCVANLMPIKSIDLLLDAWRQLPGDQRQARLLIVGDGPMREELQRLAERLQCADSVTFLGHREDVPALLRSADLFVVSSRYEACSIAILEAMATGLAVVATDVGGNRELVETGKTGWLVPPDRADLLASAVSAAFKDDHLRQRCGQNARTIATERHSLDECARRYATLFHSLLNPSGRLPAARMEDDGCAE
jgi:glycosyltransferase involved in cell wall biosynthesis